MKRQRLTDRKIASLKALGNKRTDFYDDIVTGLAIRISPNGAKSWSLHYRLDGRIVRDTLGKYPAKGLAKARQEAQDRLAVLAQGRDPRQEDARRDAAEAKRRADTFEVVAGQYKKAKLSKLRSGDEQWAAIERDFMPNWRNTPLKDIGRAAVLARLDEIEAEFGPYARNRRASLICALLNFALDRELIESNPAARIEHVGEVERDRVLTDAELVEIWHAAGKLQQPYGPLVRMLLLTGQRRSEISDMQNPELDRETGLLTIAAGRMKAKVAHEVPLPPAALALLDDLPEYAEPKVHIFASLRRQDSPVNAFSQIKGELDKLILAARLEKDPKAQPMSPWRFHDLRRTMRSGLSRLRIPRDISERVIAHTPGGVEKIYDRHEFREEKRQALEAWANYVSNLLTPKSNVTTIARKAS